jgi:hypothetical protein
MKAASRKLQAERQRPKAESKYKCLSLLALGFSL